MTMNTQLIEKTAKRYKARQVLAVATMLVGGVWAAIAASVEADVVWPLGVFAFGAIWRAWLKVTIWWHHG